jgi:hypothetical protein
LATLPSAGTPAHVERKDWVLIPAEKLPVHSDPDEILALTAIVFFRSRADVENEEGQAEISLPLNVSLSSRDPKD